MSRYIIKVKDDHSDYEIIKHIFSNENQKKLFGYKCFKCNWCKVGVEFLFLDVIVPDYNNDKFAQILESANCELAIYEYTNDIHIRYMEYCRCRYYKRYLIDFYISGFVEAICQHRLDYTSLCRRLQHEGDAIGVDLSTSKGVWIQVDGMKWKCPKCDVVCVIALYSHGDRNFCPNCGTHLKNSAGGETYETN